MSENKRKSDCLGDSEEKKDDSSPSKSIPGKKKKQQPRGTTSLTLNVFDNEDDKAVVLLADNFSISMEHAKAVFKACQSLQPDDPAVFVSFADAGRIHQALMLPGPGRPCPPGQNADESFDLLQAWVSDLLPTGQGTKAKVISGGSNGIALSNLTQEEFNAIQPIITHHPNDLTWAAAVRAANLSCGGALFVTGTGVGSATVGKMSSTVFFDD